MRKLSIVLSFLIILLLTMPLYALGTSTTTRAFAVVKQTANLTEMEFTTPAYKFVETKLAGTSYVKVETKADGYLCEPGYPELPTWSTLVAVPAHGKVSVKVVENGQASEVAGVAYPSQETTSGRSTAFLISQDLYQSQNISQTSSWYGISNHFT